MAISVTYRGRQGRRTPQGYRIRTLVTTSDGKEFWGDEADRQAQDHCRYTKQAGDPGPELLRSLLPRIKR